MLVQYCGVYLLRGLGGLWVSFPLYCLQGCGFNPQPDLGIASSLLSKLILWDSDEHESLTMGHFLPAIILAIILRSETAESISYE